MTFQKAERRQAKLKLALTGPSGAGKTLSALLLARGLGGKIAVVDTENGSASLYAGEKKFGAPEFDTLVIEPPYTVQKYLAGIKAAVEAGYDVLIIDSISHVWAGDGGLLAKKEAMDARGGNSFSNWGSITKEHEAFKATLLNCDVHLICTMRSKQDYVLEQNDKGKSAPRKVGLAPIQRDGMEYEFTTVFDIGMDHNASVSKDRTGLFDGQITTLSEKTGAQFMAWLSGAKAAPAKMPQQPEEAFPPDEETLEENPDSEPRMATIEDHRAIWATLKNTLKLDDVRAREFLRECTGKPSSKDYTSEDVRKVFAAVRNRTPSAPPNVNPRAQQ